MTSQASTGAPDGGQDDGSPIRSLKDEVYAKFDHTFRHLRFIVDMDPQHHQHFVVAGIYKEHFARLNMDPSQRRLEQVVRDKWLGVVEEARREDLPPPEYVWIEYPPHSTFVLLYWGSQKVMHGLHNLYAEARSLVPKARFLASAG